MLANFWADVGIVRVESREGIFEGVGSAGFEADLLRERRAEEVKGRAPFFSFERGERLQFAEGPACFDGRD